MDESGDNKIYLSSSLFGNHKKPQITLSPVRLQKVKGEEGFDGDKKSFTGGNTVWSVSKEQTTESIRPVHYSHSHSKKVIKHALRQQAKRRRKNTTIAAGNSAPVPRYVTTSLDNTEEEPDNRFKEPTKMIDILSSIPDFRIKHRKRTNKKLSTAAQLEQTKEGCVDLETPDSILLQTNLRDLLNKHTFSSLPPFYQYKLVQLLPHVDRVPVTSQADCVYRLNPTGLSNEFFNRACTEWKERLAEGEFTPENQQKRKLEVERDKNKLDPWKVKHFEPIWGENSNVVNNTFSVHEKESVSPKSANKTPTKRPVSPVLRNRTVGAVTRSVSQYREKREAEDTGGEVVKKFKSVTCAEAEKTVGENLEEEVDKTSTTDVVTIISIDHDSTERTNDTVDAPVEDRSSVDNEKSQPEKPCDDSVPQDVAGSQKSDSESPPVPETLDEEVPIMDDVPIDDMDNDNLLDHTIEIENIICEEDGNWNNDREEAAILAAAWDAVESGSESLLAQVDLDRDHEESIANQEEGEKSPEEETLQKISQQEEAIVQDEEAHSPTPQWSDHDQVSNDEQVVPEPNNVPSVDENICEEASPMTQVENQVTSTEESKTVTSPEQPTDNIVAPDENADEVVVKEETEVEHEPLENATAQVSPPEEENSPKSESEEIQPTEAAPEAVQFAAEEPSEIPAEVDEEEKPEDDEASNEENELLNQTINIEKMIREGEAWDNNKAEQVQAAILAAAWDAVDSNTEKLLAEVAMEGDNEVAVIPMQEELEVRLEESSLPAPEWVDYDGKSEENSQSADDDQKLKPIQYTGGHVKLELEVTLTPEVDNQVTSTVESGTSTSTNVITSSNTILAPSTVIPPTTIVCLPSSNPSVPTPPTTQLVTNQAVSSSALPYIALTTNTPVRAVPSKMQVKSGGRGGRNTSNKPPPGAVNLERSYQICQAVIQNSPNRDQLKFQLKPPPSLLLSKDNYKTQNATRGGHTKPTKTYNASACAKPSTLIKHVFHSPQGIPVTMAVLPTSNTELTESQMGQYLLVQRSGFGSGVRRSNSAPPTNQKSSYGVGGRGRPASVGLQQQQQGNQPPKMCTIVTSQNAQTYYSVPQKYGIGMNEDCSCSFKAMVICLKCGAFCHDNCIGPGKVCVNCR